MERVPAACLADARLKSTCNPTLPFSPRFSLEAGQDSCPVSRLGCFQGTQCELAGSLALCPTPPFLTPGMSFPSAVESSDSREDVPTLWVPQMSARAG